MTQILIRQQQSQSNASGTATFKFGSVEPGYTWTFSILPVVPTIPSYNFGNSTPIRGQDAFGNAVWTMYRNNIPEFTWTGYSIPKNIQAVGMENVSVQGLGLTPNTQYTVTLRGSSDLSSSVSPMVPEFDQINTPGNGPDSSDLIIGITTAAAGNTSHLVPSAAGVQLRVWTLGITMAQTNSTGGAALVQQAANVNTTSGITIGTVGCSTYAAGSVSQNSVSLDMKGLLIPVGDGLDLISPPGVGANFCTATCVFSQV